MTATSRERPPLRRAAGLALGVVLAMLCTACSWSEDDAGGTVDAATSVSPDDQSDDQGDENDGSAGGDSDDDAADSGGDGDAVPDGSGGAAPSPVRVTSAAQQVGNNVPVGLVAEQLTAEMTEACGGTLCVDIVTVGEYDCRYASSVPGFDQPVGDDRTITLEGDCAVRLVFCDASGEWVADAETCTATQTEEPSGEEPDGDESASEGGPTDTESTEGAP